MDYRGAAAVAAARKSKGHHTKEVLKKKGNHHSPPARTPPLPLANLTYPPGGQNADRNGKPLVMVGSIFSKIRRAFSNTVNKIVNVATATASTTAAVVTQTANTAVSGATNLFNYAVNYIYGMLSLASLLCQKTSGIQLNALRNQLQ